MNNFQGNIPIHTQQTAFICGWVLIEHELMEQTLLPTLPLEKRIKTLALKEPIFSYKDKKIQLPVSSSPDKSTYQITTTQTDPKIVI